MLKYTTILLLLSFVTFSQTNFKKGYVVKNNGDTLHVELDFSELNFRNNQIYFKYKNTDSVVVVTPKNCKAFGIENNIEYHVKSVIINLTQVESDKSNWEVLPEKLEFLQLLSKGKLNLYSLKYVNNNHLYFIEDGENKPEQLIYHSFVKENTSKIFNNNYINQLYFATRDKKTSTNGLNYEDNSIFKFVERYNNLLDKNKIKSAYLKVGLGGTLYIPSEAPTTTFEKVISPAASAEFIFPMLKKRKSKASFVFGLNYNLINLKKTPNNSSFSSFFRLKSIRSNILSGNLGVLISPLKFKIEPYFGAGVGYNITFGNSIYNNDGTHYRVSTRSSSKGDYIFNKDGFRFYYKAGLQLTKKIGLEGKFDKLPSSKFAFISEKENLYTILFYWRI